MEKDQFKRIKKAMKKEKLSRQEIQDHLENSEVTQQCAKIWDTENKARRKAKIDEANIQIIE